MRLGFNLFEELFKRFLKAMEHAEVRWYEFCFSVLSLFSFSRWELALLIENTLVLSLCVYEVYLMCLG
jgi:hypothetical protein